MSADFRDFVLEQLAGRSFDDVLARAMFGGYGLYSRAVLFAVLDDDQMFLRTDEAGRARFLDRGSRPFAPIPGAKPMLGYWEVPADVLEDRDELVRWSQEARTAAATAKAKKAKKHAESATAKRGAPRARR